MTKLTNSSVKFTLTTILFSPSSYELQNFFRFFKDFIYN